MAVANACTPPQCCRAATVHRHSQVALWGHEGVCSFVLEYLPEGMMRDMVARSRTIRSVVGNGAPQLPLSMMDNFRMAREITSALLHIWALLN